MPDECFTAVSFASALRINFARPTLLVTQRFHGVEARREIGRQVRAANEQITKAAMQIFATSIGMTSAGICESW